MRNTTRVGAWQIIKYAMSIKEVALRDHLTPASGNAKPGGRTQCPVPFGESVGPPILISYNYGSFVNGEFRRVDFGLFYQFPVSVFMA